MINTQNYQEILQQAFNAAKDNQSGNNADYIPFLKNIPSDLGAIAIVTASGDVFSVGDDSYRFAIESISKFCTLALALEEQGPEVVKDKIGASPTGLPFNSVTALELDKWQSILKMQQQLGSDKIEISPELNKSEQDTNFHNRAIAWLLYSAGYLYSDPMEACDVYTRQCSTLLTVVELATMGATIANKGTNPITKQAILKPDNVSYILAEMMMEGMYDSSGEWAYTVGLPSKSGVGGGVLSIVPGVMGIAAFSPKLDTVGNSVRGQEMIQYIADQLNLSLFKR